MISGDDKREGAGVLLTILVFFGVNVAWLLLFDETPAASTPTAQRKSVVQC